VGQDAAEVDLMNRAILASALALSGAVASADTFTTGRPDIKSISALAFGPEGVLFVGDGKGGSVFAIELGTREPQAVKEPKEIADVEGKVAALLGAAPADVMIHDLAVDPIGKRTFLAVSRGRASWNMQWLLPNDVADANVLVRFDGDGKPEVVDLSSVRHARVALPNPVDAAKTVPWKKTSLRSDAITDMAYADGALYVAGLSNEEFAASMWRVAYPFAGAVSVTTIENYHGAHGKYETEAPVRTFVPYALKGKTHLLAAYLCTPLVTFQASDLKDKQHVRGRTVGEFGSGNYPLDMVLVKSGGKDKLLIANSNLPLMVVDPKDVEAYEGAIDKRVETYTAGVKFEQRSGTGIQQMDNLGDEHIVVLRRLAGGRLDLTPVPLRRF
jgi:hypothetical protein